MPLVNLLFWGALLLAVLLGFGAAFVACFVAIAVGRKRKWPILQWGGVSCLIVTGLAALGSLAGVVWVVIYSLQPESVYAACFGEEPTPDVAHLQAEASGFADCYVAFLRFEASRETFERLIPAGAARVTFEEYDDRMPGSNLRNPDWWEPIDSDTSEIYFLEPAHGEVFMDEITVMTYDAEHGVVQYHFHGID